MRVLRTDRVPSGRPVALSLNRDQGSSGFQGQIDGNKLAATVKADLARHLASGLVQHQRDVAAGAGESSFRQRSPGRPRAQPTPDRGPEPGRPDVPVIGPGSEEYRAAEDGVISRGASPYITAYSPGGFP